MDGLLQTDQIDTLVFIPVGALLTVPMAALYDGMQFLIHNYALAVIPGLTLMDPSPIKHHQLQVLKCGLSESVQGFSGLSFVPDELANIQRIFHAGETFQDQRFVNANVEKAVLKTP